MKLYLGRFCLVLFIMGKITNKLALKLNSNKFKVYPEYIRWKYIQTLYPFVLFVKTKAVYCTHLLIFGNL